MKRAERFGTTHPEVDRMKKEQRAARFGIVDEDTKKKQRLDKFKPLVSETSKPGKAPGKAGTASTAFGAGVKADDEYEAKRKVRGRWIAHTCRRCKARCIACLIACLRPCGLLQHVC